MYVRQNECNHDSLALTLLQSTIPSMAARGTSPSEKTILRDLLAILFRGSGVKGGLRVIGSDSVLKLHLRCFQYASEYYAFVKKKLNIEKYISECFWRYDSRRRRCRGQAGSVELCVDAR